MTTICHACKHHRFRVQPKQPDKADLTYLLDNQECVAPGVDRECVSHVTGCRWQRTALCRDINTSGECPYYEPRPTPAVNRGDTKEG